MKCRFVIDGIRSFRRFQVFDPLDFLAEISQHIPDARIHAIRYFGWYSNNKCVYGNAMNGDDKEK